MRVYTLDADMVMIAASLPDLIARLQQEGFTTDEHAHSLNAVRGQSELRMQFTTDERYQPLLQRAVEAEVLGVRVWVASLADVTQRKLWAYSDPQRRLTKRKKDELDLIRLAESYPELIALYPAELARQIEP